MKDHILTEIRRLTALNNGQPPGKRTFLRETGIAEHHWNGKFWSRWGDAISEAGYEPNTIQEKFNGKEILSKIVAAARYYGRIPTNNELKIYRRNVETTFPSINTVTNHYSSKSILMEALLKFVADDPNYADIRAMLPLLPAPEEVPALKPLKSIDGFVYLIKSGDFYKIGRSDDIERRVKEIRIALPDKAVLAHTIRTDDPAGIEAYWHQRFKDKRANGEWFRLTSLDIAAFKKRKYQ